MRTVLGLEIDRKLFYRFSNTKYSIFTEFSSIRLCLRDLNEIIAPNIYHD